MALIERAPGAVHLAHHLPIDRQIHLASRCLELGEASVGFYTPVVRGRYPMSVRMLCLGRHWDATTYRYEEIRSDVDGQPVPDLPADFAALAREVAGAAGYAMRPDICIVNWYRAGSRMGLHQDKDESDASIASGAPIVSISLGDTGKFLFGGPRRKDPVETILLASGDAFVFGGAARLNYHGITRILPNTAPAGLGFEGRLNLTYRQY
jgi:alkylated DNA repair protein (DNA oxidative demethylase)